MALRDYDEVRKEADLLTPEEQKRLANHLLNSASRPAKRKQRIDVNALAGTIKLKEDAMAIQRRLRREWD